MKNNQLFINDVLKFESDDFEEINLMYQLRISKIMKMINQVTELDEKIELKNHEEEVFIKMHFQMGILKK